MLSTQVLEELCVSLIKKTAHPLGTEEVRILIEDYTDWDVVVNRPDSVLHALSIAAKHKISFWNALILHAAETSGAETLYSEDLSDGQLYGAVRVVNPLKVIASEYIFRRSSQLRI